MVNERIMEAYRPSRAKAYFDEIKSKGVGFLHVLVTSPTPTFESEFLDFKGAYVLDLKTELPGLWAKNLSCFANSDGGVLIFGIDAPKGQAKNLSLSQDLAALTDTLKKLVPRITEPPVQRVEIDPYEDPAGSNKGFVVCFIPSSPWRPHQVKTEGQPGQFYTRATDNCIPCNHATLRALFAPQYVSLMQVHYRTVAQRQAGGDEIAFLHCILENKGPATAREVFVLLDSNQIGDGPIISRPLWATTTTARPGRAYICSRSIHPDEQLEICHIPLGLITNKRDRDFRRQVFEFELSISARDQAPTDFEIKVDSDSIPDPTLRSATLVQRD